MGIHRGAHGPPHLAREPADVGRRPPQGNVRIDWLECDAYECPLRREVHNEIGST